ncbi:hypothetical protein ACFVHQ_12175 [Actinomycetes bacterium NPDC127524]
MVGTITGEPIKFIGKKLNNDYIQEIGDGVKNATTNTGATIGSIAEGTWNTATGLFNKDELKRDEGIKELKNTAIHTVKGNGTIFKEYIHKWKDVGQGVVSNDKDQLIKGVKGVGKTIAVAALAVGVLDVFDVVDVVDVDGVDNKS